MSTKYHYYSYLQTDDKEINLTACSDSDTGINAWNSRYALRKAAEESVRRLHAYSTNRSWRSRTARASSLTEHGPKRHAGLTCALSEHLRSDYKQEMGVWILCMHVVSPSKGYIFAKHAKDLQNCRGGVRWTH